MKSGICPKCESRKVHVLTSDEAIRALSMRQAKLSQFVCLNCGFVELYIQDPELLPAVGLVSQKISSENVLGLEDAS